MKDKDRMWVYESKCRICGTIKEPACCNIDYSTTLFQLWSYIKEFNKMINLPISCFCKECRKKTIHDIVSLTTETQFQEEIKWRSAHGPLLPAK